MTISKGGIVKISFIILFILFLSCSGSKEIDNAPIPIGGEQQVRSVLYNELGKDYYNLSGKRLELKLNIDKNGAVEKVSFPTHVSPRSEENVIFESKITNAFIDHIKFTPATKDGNPIGAEFKYYFTF